MPQNGAFSQGRRTGWQLWQFLKPRLVLLVGMRRVWGQLDELYQSRAHSMFEEQPLPPYIIDPDSAFSMWCAHAHTRTRAHAHIPLPRHGTRVWINQRTAAGRLLSIAASCSSPLPYT